MAFFFCDQMQPQRQPSDLKTSEKRTLIKKLIKVIQPRKDRVTVDEMLKMSHELQRSQICKPRLFNCQINVKMSKSKPHISCAVESGGVLFEDYAVNWGTWSSRKKARALIRLAADERRMITSSEMASLLQTERVPFYAHIIMTCTHFGTCIKWQMFYLHTGLKFRGISNAGCDLLRKLGMAMARRSYDALAKEIVQEALTETR
jgi:hypothetical protein